MIGMGSLRNKKIAKIQSSYIEQREKKLQQKMKNRIGLKRRLIAFAIVALVFLGVTVSTMLSQSSALNEKQEKKEKLTTKLHSLEKEQQLLEEEIIKLNDDEYIAKIARRDYFLSNEGEFIFNLPKKEEEKD